jgi:predicted HAD superfamily phosphohydrolase
MTFHNVATRRAYRELALAKVHLRGAKTVRAIRKNKIKVKEKKQLFEKLVEVHIQRIPEAKLRKLVDSVKCVNLSQYLKTGKIYVQ